MLVAVVMIVLVMRMLMMRMIVMRMAVVCVVVMRMAGDRIRLERRLDHDGLRATLAEQGLDLRVALDAQPVGEELHRHMPVAEQPRDAREYGRIGDARLDQRFRRS